MHRRLEEKSKQVLPLFFQPPSKDEDITVTIVPGVTTGDLSAFFKKNNVCLKSNVILDKVTYGGVIATGCHVR